MTEQRPFPLCTLFVEQLYEQRSHLNLKFPFTQYITDLLLVVLEVTVQSLELSIGCWVPGERRGVAKCEE